MKPQRWFDFQCAPLYLPRCNTTHKGLNPSTESLVMKMPPQTRLHASLMKEIPELRFPLPRWTSFVFRWQKSASIVTTWGHPTCSDESAKGKMMLLQPQTLDLWLEWTSGAMGGAVQHLSELARGCYQGRNWNSGTFPASVAEQGGIIKIQTIAAHRRWPCSVLKPGWAPHPRIAWILI